MNQRGVGVNGGRVAVVTGAAGGFGRLIVRGLLADGVRVYAVMRGGAGRLEDNLRSAHQSGQLVAIDLDLVRFDDYPAALAPLGREPAIHLLVNIAGYALFGPAAAASAEELSHLFTVNVHSPLQLVRHLLPQLTAGRGRVLNMSSIAGQVTFPFYGPYAASKRALEALSEALALELRAVGVEVAIIEPMGYKTDSHRLRRFTRAALEPHSPFARRMQRFIAYLDENAGRHQGDPAEVAALVLRLARAPRLQLRYPVGRNAGAIVWLQRLLPDSWSQRVYDWAFRKHVFGEVAK